MILFEFVDFVSEKRYCKRPGPVQNYLLQFAKHSRRVLQG
jgi:hypothetical protein